MKFNIERLFDIRDLVKELSIGLLRLNFDDNFESFEQTVEITAGSTAEIRNRLQFIPSKYIITSQTGNGVVTKTGTWTLDKLFLINNGAVTVNINVTFLK